MKHIPAKSFINTPVPYAAAPIQIGNITRWVGAAAHNMAATSGRAGGPGFEADILREITAEDANWFLQRAPGSVHFGSSDPYYNTVWDWRIYANGKCVFQRLTKRHTRNLTAEHMRDATPPTPRTA